jgi:DNA-binding ferritin-like protein
MMENHSIQDVHNLVEESICQIKLSLDRISEALTKLEEAIEEQNDFSDYNFIEGKQDIKNLRHCVSEIHRMTEKKRDLLKQFVVIRKRKKHKKHKKRNGRNRWH